MEVEVTIDRPIGYVDSFGNVYPVNYGYIRGVIGGDGEEQDAYVLDNSINSPIHSYKGKVIAEIIRYDDVETKLIVSNDTLTILEIKEKINFIEKYFKSKVIMKNK